MPTSSQSETPILEKYRPIAHLGAGGMGQVFHGRIAFPLHQARSCAIKTIRPDRLHARGIARFTHEAMIGWDLTGHRNIITTRSFDQWPDGQLYVVLDREGPSLHNILEQLHGQFAIIHLIAEHMLDALAHLQTRHIIHGDISTGNILLGRDGHAKLSDFGLSRRADAHGTARPSSHFGDGLVGVPAYASPETLNGESPTFASDLYSLGAVLHELAAGRPPHGSYDFTEMVIRVQLDPPGHLPGKTPDALARLIRGLTEKDPAQRPSIEQAHAILEQGSGPRADRKVIAEISNTWVEAAKEKRGLESPSTRSDLLDVAARHISLIHAADRPPGELLDRRQPMPQQPPEPDNDPEPTPHPHRRPHLITGILAMLLALALALMVRQADDEQVENPPSNTAIPETSEEQQAPIPTSSEPASTEPTNADPLPAEHLEASPVPHSKPSSPSSNGTNDNVADTRDDPGQELSNERPRYPRSSGRRTDHRDRTSTTSEETQAVWRWTPPE